METNIVSQAYSFFSFIINGFLIGIIFDIFRILRKSFKTPDFITYIEDIVFWILSGVITLFNIIILNNGEIRLYIFIALIIGVIIYMITLSKILIKSSVVVINFIKKVLSKVISILLFPLKIMKKPINFVFNKLNKIVQKIHFKNPKKCKNLQKN